MALAAGLLANLAGCASQATEPTDTRFEFHSAFLMNLHHFLFDAARHPERLAATEWTKPPTPAEMATLREAVATYAATFGKRNLRSDDELAQVRLALARAEDFRKRPEGLGLPPALEAVLARAAPVYAHCLWASQDRRNLDWIARVQVLQARYGAQIQPRLERIFDARYPATIRDDVVVDTGTFTGAYTSTTPPQTVLPSGWPDYDGLAALEMLWHEASHTGPDDRLIAIIETEAGAMGRPAPDDLWHAALFEAVGVTVADVYARAGVRGYVPYAERRNVYGHGWEAYVPLLHGPWRAWIDGSGTLKGAVDAMLAELPAAPGTASP